jgi:DinB superfamily
MSTETSLVDSALRNWSQQIERANNLFAPRTEPQLLQEIAPGKNRLIYIWGHLTSINDALIPLLGFGERLHPELDAMFVKNPDRGAPIISASDLKHHWDEINQRLGTEFAKLSPSEWTQKHTTVSEEDFKKEPHRNRFTILLGRTGHMAYHIGQAVLADGPR